MFKTTLFIAVALVLANATDFVFVNQCSGDITVDSATSQGTSPLPDGGLPLPQGQTATLSASDWIGNIFADPQPASLAEFALNQWGGLDFYDISLIVGFNLGIQISPSNGCQQVTCQNTPCSDAYMQPDDNFATHSCAVGASYQITFCP